MFVSCDSSVTTTIGIQSFLSSLEESLPVQGRGSATPSPQGSPVGERRSKGGSRIGIKMEKQTGERVVSTKNMNVLSPLNNGDDDDNDDEEKEQSSGKKSPSVSPNMGRYLNCRPCVSLSRAPLTMITYVDAH